MTSFRLLLKERDDYPNQKMLVAASRKCQKVSRYRERARTQLDHLQCLVVHLDSKHFSKNNKNKSQLVLVSSDHHFENHGCRKMQNDLDIKYLEYLKPWQEWHSIGLIPLTRQHPDHLWGPTILDKSRVQVFHHNELMKKVKALSFRWTQMTARKEQIRCGSRVRRMLDYLRNSHGQIQTQIDQSLASILEIASWWKSIG